MKRILLILLAVLLLAGCGRRGQNTPGDEDATQSEATTGLYIPNSAEEQQTGGAVRTYGLEKDNYTGLYGMGSHLLLAGQKGLTVLTGQVGEVTARLETGDVAANTVVDTAAIGMAYYLPNTRQVVVLNPYLQEVTRLELPKELVGNPYISLTKNEIYYSVGNEIRALNITGGFSRLIRQQTTVTQTLLGVYFDGGALLCNFADETGAQTLAFISTESGQNMGGGRDIVKMQTSGDRYIVFWQDGTVLQTVYGTKGADTQGFHLSIPSVEVSGGRGMLPAMNGLVDYAMTEQGLSLSFYDLSTGRCTARTVLSGVKSPSAFYSDGTYIWMLATDTQKVQQTLYRWDVAMSAVQEEQAWAGPLYTAENPDVEGLKQCRELANTYEKEYGVKLLWNTDVKHTGGHNIKAEYHPQMIRAALEKLQPFLAQFPERFLLKTVEAGWIKIALVQDIEGDADWVQFWEEGDCWVLLSVTGDLVDGLTQGMSYGVDSHVLGNSRDFDNWAEMNPEGFAYTYTETPTEELTYLAGDTRAFADAKSTCYPHEDRCRLFYNAMLADNGDMFQAPVMQAKLIRLCTGIREAYSLEKKTVTYPWEQYLQTSLAYVPK